MTLKDIRNEVEAIQEEATSWKNDDTKAWMLERTISLLGLITVEEAKQ